MSLKKNGTYFLFISDLPHGHFIVSRCRQVNGLQYIVARVFVVDNLPDSTTRFDFVVTYIPFRSSKDCVSNLTIAHASLYLTLLEMRSRAQFTRHRSLMTRWHNKCIARDSTQGKSRLKPLAKSLSFLSFITEYLCVAETHYQLSLSLSSRKAN